ncbi:hypothetical protein [Bradyrhizobium genosp. A]|uniref:hypothetical protein n=1 Tax=Bradyrhizobium genosp. A TaxID=83626 RepID=UPI003CFB6F5E
MEEANGLDWPARFGTQAAQERTVGCGAPLALHEEFDFTRKDCGQFTTLRERLSRRALHQEESRRG